MRMIDFSLFPDRSPAIGYGVNPLDRLSAGRDDARLLSALTADPASVSFAIVQDKFILESSSGAPQALFGLNDVAGFGAVQEVALLGRDQTRAYFVSLLSDHAAHVPADLALTHPHMPPQLTLVQRPDLALADLRGLAVQGLFEPNILGMMAQAKSIMHWHARHRFCSVCGSPSVLASAGWKRECVACQAPHFPRTDPVVIMLAIDGDQCLLGRQARFGKGMYSALAGFLEPGETMEAAVRREIHEEAGIEIGRVRYLASQPWPFPASLMIGCLAEAVTREITIDHTELEDARWFSKQEAKLMLAGTHPDGLLPPGHIAIASHLLRAFVEGHV
jgi:NAD+ diphosphatase